MQRLGGLPVSARRRHRLRERAHGRPDRAVVAVRGRTLAGRLSQVARESLVRYPDVFGREAFEELDAQRWRSAGHREVSPGAAVARRGTRTA